MKARNMKIALRWTAAILLALIVDGACPPTVCAQDDVAAAEEKEQTMLDVGSKAPSLDISNWVHDGNGKFAKVSDFETGKVYVVEFWATWCGPCVASMPHLAETQKLYADKGVQLISVSDEDLETVDEFLKRKVRGNLAEQENGPKTYGELTSVYCLTTDPDGSVYSDYMTAAGENGIPTAFIVGKDGVIEWIGHPMSMDEPLKQVVDGDWDRVAYVAKRAQEKELEKTMALVRRDVMIVQAMERAGNYDRAIEKLEGIIEKVSDNPMAVGALSTTKLYLLCRSGSEKATETLHESVRLTGDDPTNLNDIAWSIYEILADMESIDQDLLAAAVKYSQKSVDAEPKSAFNLDTLAHLVYLQGDIDKAIEFQSKAVELDDTSNEDVSNFLKQLKKEKKEK
jgi:thiol-disulfide isomerase/thioredoxin